MLQRPADGKQLFKGNGKARLLRNQGRKFGNILEELPRTDDLKMKRERREYNERVDRERTMISRIFVGNLIHTVTHKTLARIFKTLGSVSQVIIGCFRYAPDSTSFAEIIFKEPIAFTTATYLNGLILEGRALVVCRKRTETPEWRGSSKKPSPVSSMKKSQAPEAFRLTRESNQDSSSLAEVSRCLPLAEASLQ